MDKRDERLDFSVLYGKKLGTESNFASDAHHPLFGVNEIALRPQFSDIHFGVDRS
jgi:hypothetical protein